jgi:hypothetical protein
MAAQGRTRLNLSTPAEASSPMAFFAQRRKGAHSLWFAQQLLDFRLQSGIFRITFHVLSTRMYMTDDTAPIDQKAHARPSRVSTIQPPLLQCPPTRIHGDWEFESQLPRVLAHGIEFECFGRFVMIKSNDLEALRAISSEELVQGGRRCAAIGATGGSPPANQDHLTAKIRQIPRH